ncbi:MAG TPA: tyrosine-type recombinase/integrase [Candidatus Binatus sp.]|nr:tyrosine-type recombinase/integrase [Candidatus Binatus sp.]
MASIIARPGGRHEIQLRVGISRHTIRLGKTSRRIAETIKAKIEALAVAHELGVEPDIEVTVWIDRQAGAKLRHRLARAGLCSTAPRIVDVGLKAFAEGFLTDYRAGNEGTKRTLGVAFSRLVAYFGAERSMRSISLAKAEACREHLEAAGFAEATISTTIKKARQLWVEALKRSLVDANVWLEVRAGSQDNAERQFYVNRETVEQVLTSCKSVEWRLVIALCRYAGLRCPSEHLRLRRGDIDWGKGRFRVRGKGNKDRTVPLFPELRPFLEAAESAAKLNATYLIVRWREVTAGAWRQKMLRLLHAAGATPWPRLFHNLRASCETDLVAAGHPLHVVGRWLGNSEAIARRHYLQPREADFEKAMGRETLTDEKSEERGASRKGSRKSAG